VAILPKAQNTQTDLVGYTLSFESDKDALRLTRTLKSDVIYLQPDQYETLHRFYQAVRTADEQQIVLQPAGTSTAN